MPEVIESAAPAIESAPVESTSTETPDLAVESTESVDSTQETNVDEQSPQEQTTDGRRMPDEFKQYLKELRATNPNLARRLANEYHLAQQIRSSYPGGMKDIQKVAQIAEAIGGEEGIAAIEAERAEWNALDQQFTAGDPEFVKNISTQDPEAFKKLVPHALTQYSQLDPDGYAHLLAPILRDTIEPTVRKLYDTLSQDEKYKPLAAELAKWYNGIDEVARNKPVPKVDPEREKFNQERQEWENQRTQEYHQSITNEMRQFNAKQIGSDLAAQLTKANQNAAAFQKANPESYEILLKNCNDNIQVILNKDQTFMKQYSAVLASGDRAKALNLAQSKIRAVSPEAVKRTLRAFLAFGRTPANVRPVPGVPTNGTIPSGKEVQLGRMPEPKEIDWSRTDPKMVTAGKAFIKGKKEMVRF